MHYTDCSNLLHRGFTITTMIQLCSKNRGRGSCVVIFVGAVRNMAAEPEGRSRVHQAPGAIEAPKVLW